MVYLIFYVCESVIRYCLHLVGADYLIFIRDIVLITPVVVVFIQQAIRKKIDPAFHIFAFVMLVHGFISIINIGSWFVVLYSIKVFVSILAGAVFAENMMKPYHKLFIVVFIMWFATFLSVMLDKYFVEFPWTALETTIGDIQVEISRNWTITGEDKRAGGMMRSSINVAIVQPLLAFIVMFNLRSNLGKIIVFAMTLATIYWTTQKASIVAFVFTCGLLAISYRRFIISPASALKLGISLAIILMIALPLILPYYTMPNEKMSVFSLSSFYLRVEDMWPRAWIWIEQREIFPFGVGLGGIGGGQRFYITDLINAADNMFIFLYAHFGVFSFVYLGIIWWWCVRIPNKLSQIDIHALCIILFLFFYGCAMSVIEDQMATVSLGAAVAWLATWQKRANEENQNISKSLVLNN